MPPLVSVIIPTHNRLTLMKRAIQSVQAQTYQTMELIVVDDGSSDGTLEWIHSLKDVQCIRETHQGVSHARNVGIQKARGDFIAFLDSDDEWQPEKIQKQIEFFKKQSDGLIVQTEEIWIRNGRRVNPMKKHQKHSGWIFDKCLPLCIVSPSAVMIRRELFSEIGLFDETLPACEDYDLWLRIAAHYPIYLLDEPLVIKHGGRADQLSQQITALDRYRIESIAKLLTSPHLKPRDRESAYETLREKCRIYGNGCLKRGKEEEGYYFLDLPNQIQSAKLQRMVL